MLMGGGAEEIGANDEYSVEMDVPQTAAGLIALAIGALKPAILKKAMADAYPFEICEHIKDDAVKVLFKLGEKFATVFDQDTEIEVDADIAADIANAKMPAEAGLGDKIPLRHQKVFGRILTLAHR